MLVLVVGANGQLGARVCEELLRKGHQVRGSVRDAARARDLGSRGVDVVVGDLTDPEGLRSALAGVEAVVLTANAVVPRRSDDPPAVQQAMERLVGDAEDAGVRRFVLPSVPSGPVDSKVGAIAARRALERRLLDSPLEAAVLRFPPFMEVWLALVGSSLPLRAEPHATVARPSPFLRRFRRLTGTLVEDRGLMLVPGRPSARQAFIAIGDVATAVAAATEAPTVPKQAVEIGGPEILTWAQVAEVYADVLGRPVRVLATPAAVYALGAAALARWAAVPSATLALNRFVAETETPWSPGRTGMVDPARMTTVRDFLAAKAATSFAEPQRDAGGP